MKNKNFVGKHGPLLIAEIGGNHEGDFEYAKKLTRDAISTNVDFIKFQIYTGDTLVSEVESPDRNRHFKKFELSKEQHIELAQMVVNAGIGYMSSVWDIESMGWIDEYIPIYKIGSGDLTAYPVLRQTAKTGKPIIISTGLATEQEVKDSISFIVASNPVYKDPNMLAVLQCTSMYPIGAEDANLSVMLRYQDFKADITVGYSDHTEGSKALKYAVAMGAKVLEFHFTDSREGKVFRDHKVSLVPSEVRDLIEEITFIRQLMGNPSKMPVQVEVENGHDISFRRAIFPACDIKKGQILTEDNLTVLRPNVGIDAREFDKIIGKVANIDLKRHQKLDWEYIS